MATAFKIHKNGAVSTLASSMTAGATSLTLATGTGTKFPAVSGGGYWVTIWSSAIPNPLNDTGMEIVLVTAISGDVLTVTRSQLGTNSGSTLTHATGDDIQLLIQDQNFTDIHSALNTVENNFPVAGPNLGLSLTTNCLKVSGAPANQTTTATAYAAVPGVTAPVVSIPSSGTVLLIGTIYIQSITATSSDMYCAVGIDGSTGTDFGFRPVAQFNGGNVGICEVRSGLTPGNHTFTLQFMSSGGATCQINTGRVYVAIIPMAS